MRRLVLSIVIILVTGAIASGDGHKVHVISIDGTINPTTSDFIHDQIQRAEMDAAECLIVRLNTPGGLLKSTRVIVSDFLSSRIPIVVYVSPSGSQAASAGVFITLAGHVAAMAPGTNIGAAHPVTIGEQQDSIMMQKSTNDAAAFIRTISEKRHRNIRWAEDAVRKSLSITETEALKDNIIDTIAANVEDLLRMIDGKKIETTTGVVLLHTKNASIVRMEQSFAQRFLDILSDPNIAYIFMMLGIYGLLFELYNPGLIFPGVVGVICLIMAFYSLHTLPINYAGLALMIFGVILFILEIKITSHGMLTVGGVTCLLLGSMMLIRTESAFDIISISWTVIISSTAVSAAFFLFVIGMGIRAQRLKPTTGIQGLIGEVGEAITALTPSGKIRIHGEIWSAVSLEGRIDRGTKVKADALDNLKLKVRKLES